MAKIQLIQKNNHICLKCGIKFYRSWPRSGKPKYCNSLCYWSAKKGTMTGKNNPMWKGKDIGYFTLHSWVQRKLGKALVCVDCKSTTHVQWANISQKYKRDLSDWKQLCSVCHRRFDGITKFSKEDANKIKELHKSGVTQVALSKRFGVNKTTIYNIVRNKIQYYG